MKIHPLYQDGFGVEIHGFDAKRATPQAVDTIKQNLYRHRAVVLRDQEMNLAEYANWAKLLGRPQVYPQDNYHHPDHPEVFVTSNVGQGVARTGYYWHTDCPWLNEPLPLTMLFPQFVPEGRETLFIDMARVYSRLKPALVQRLQQLVAHHGPKGRYKIRKEDVGMPLHELLDAVRSEFPGANHPSVIRHPVTSEKILFLNEGFTEYLVDCETEESAQLLEEVFSFTQRSEHVYTHRYAARDILIWDNRLVLHKSGAGTSPDSPYLIYRIGVFDGQPFYVS